MSADKCWNVPNGYTTPGLKLILYNCGGVGSEDQNEIFQINEIKQ